MAFLDHIRACNRHDLSDFRPFLAGRRRVGWVRHTAAAALTGDPHLRVTGEAVVLAPAREDFDGRTAAMAAVVDRLAAAGVVPKLRGEHYPVLVRWGDDPLFQIDRAAVPFFGVHSYGVHVNGLVRRPDGLHLWVGRRAKDKAVAPGKLDNLVAGGQPFGLSLSENLRKEAAEEADLPADIADRARPVGVVTYTMETPEGLKPDTLFVYDLELPDGLMPRNTDGEVETFELWPVDKVAARVRDTDDFKFNVNLVVIDFLVRHGILTPEDPDYLSICAGLRSPPP
ncbi:MAG TPA: DUF4743 domain-containing protein [Azospirillaceae bacterium]|nr:DUF4743 domain-containing protein [Azospirillaceae bacterium]